MRPEGKLLLILLLPCWVYGAAEQPEVKPAQLPKEIKQLLNEHAPELQQLLHIWKEQAVTSDSRMLPAFVPAWLSGYILMYGLQLHNSASWQNELRLQEFIDREKLPLCVARKYLYHVPGTPLALSDENYLVVAEHADGEGVLIDLGQIEPLCKVALGVPHYNLHSRSLDQLSDGTMVILSTDSASMPSPEQAAQRLRHWLMHGSGLYTDEGSRAYNDPLTVLHRDMLTTLRYTTPACMYLVGKVKQHEALRKQLIQQERAHAEQQGSPSVCDDSTEQPEELVQQEGSELVADYPV